MATNRVTTQFDFKSNNGLKKIKADVKEANGLFGKFKASIKSSWQELNNSRSAQVAVGAAAVAMAAKSVQAASDLEESVNAVKVVYGEAGDAVLRLGEDSAESFGLSQRAFNEFSVQFSAFAEQIAENSGRSVVEVVDEMTTRVADFASVHNLSMQEAARVVQSTMAGETEAFRRFGGDVSAATIKAKAYEDGIADVGSELTEGQKVLARYSAFMEQTGETAGDFANTSDSLANQQRILAAEVEDAAAAIGENLIPVAVALAETMNATVVPAVDFALGSLNDLFETSEMFGAHIGALFGGDNVSNRKFVKEVTGAEQVALDFDKTLLDGAKTFGEARAAALENLSAYEDWIDVNHAANLIALDYRDSMAETNRVMTDYSRAQFEAATATAESTDATEDATDATEEATAATDEQRRSLSELIAEIHRGIEGTFSYEKANLELANSAASLQQRIDEVSAAHEAGELTGEEYAQAIRNIRLEEIATAEQALETAAAYAEQQGAQEGSREAARLQIDKLRELADQFPQLREEIALYIAELERIPATKSTIVTTAFVSTGNQQARPGAMAVRHTGGRVNPGEFREVLPGESFVSDSPGRIESREDTRRAMEGDGGGQRNAPLVHVEHMHVEDRTDIDAFAAAVNARMRVV